MKLCWTAPNVNNKIYINTPSYLNKTPVQKLVINSCVTGNESNYEISLSKRILNDLGVGLSIGLFNIQQDELSTLSILAGPYKGSTAYRQISNIFDESIVIRGFNINLGTLFKFNKEFSFGFGMNLKLPILQSYSMHANNSIIIVDSNGVPLYGVVTETGFTDDLTSFDSNYFIKILPIRFALGLAYHYSDDFVVSSDFTYYTGTHSEIDNFSLKAIYNYAIGSELKFIDNFAFRLGCFTNKWADASNVNNDIINSDFFGISSGIAYIKDNKSSYSLTTTYQRTNSAQYNLESSRSSVDWYSITFLLGLSYNAPRKLYMMRFNHGCDKNKRIANFGESDAAQKFFSRV